MRILIINPNTTASMTRKIGDAARAVAPSDVEIVARNPSSGPASIQGRQDGDAALPGLIEEVEKGRDEGFDAIILACFDDTGLAEARALSGMPTIGIGQAAFHTAMLLGAKFSVVTTLSVSLPVIEENLKIYGLNTMCLKVRASEVPVLDLEIPGSEAQEKISREISRSLSQDQPGAVILGCAGMADLTSQLTKRHNIPVIDGVSAAVGLACGLVRMAIWV
jgi:allantoin racemase